MFEAKGSAELDGSGAQDATLEATFRYRLGGGTVEAALAAHGTANLSSASPADWTLSAAGEEVLPRSPEGLALRGGFCPANAFAR